MRLGLPELLVVFVIGMVWIVPLAAAIWALVTLHQIRKEQAGMSTKLDAIQRAVQTSRA